MYVLLHVSWVVVTESQNDCVWRGLLEVILSSPPAHTGPSGAGCISLQTSSEYLQGEGFHNLPEQPVPLPIDPQSKKKKKSSWSSEGTLVFQFMPIASSPVTGHHWKEPGSLFLLSSLQIFLTLIRLPFWALSFPDWRVTALSAFPHKRVTLVSNTAWWAVVGLSPVSCTRESRTGPSTAGVASPVLRPVRAMITALNLLATLLLMLPGLSIAFFPAGAPC